MIRKRNNYIKKTNTLGVKRYLMPCYGSRDIYNYYRKDIKKRIVSIDNINYKQHRDILEVYNKKIVDLLVKGYDVKLPHLGELRVRKKFLTLDVLPVKNVLSEGKWVPKVKYRKKGARVKNIMFYSFKAGGVFMRKLNTHFKNDGYKRYFEV